MIDLSPKALRFVRMVAEAEPRQLDMPFLVELRTQEETRRRQPGARSARISDELGRFCLDRIVTFLHRPPIGDEEWDGNDLLYLESIAAHLSRALSPERQPHPAS